MRLLQSRAPALVLLIGFAVAVSASAALSVSANNAHLRRITRATDVLRGAMLTELHALESSLSAVREAAVVTSGGSSEWLPDSQRFIDVLDAGFANGTFGSARAGAIVRAEGNQGYRVEAIAPLEGNRQAIGFDLGSELRRRTAIERARDTGAPTLTAPIDLVQGGEHPAVILFVPAYDTLEIPKTAPVRRSRFVGGFTAVVEPATLLRASVAADLQLQVGLLDVGQIGLDGTGDDVAELLAGQVPTGSPVTMDLHAGDRRWRLVTAAGPGFGGPDRAPTAVAAVALLLLTVVLAMLVDAQLSREAETRALVDARTTDLRRSQQQLEIANARLRDADELKTSFLVTVSHELRTPLAAIRGFTALLRGEHGQPSAEDRLAYVDQLAAATDGLTDLMHEVLAFAEIEKQGPSGIAVDFAVAPLVNDVVDGQPPGHTIEVHGEGLAHGDPSGLAHALTNVLANARAYSPEAGTITVTIATAPSGTIVVHIDDEGPGIPPHERERVFERFHRGDATGTRPGTGIGLTLARALIEGMAGRISAHEAPGGGARLTMSIPCAQQRTEPADLGAEQAL